MDFLVLLELVLALLKNCPQDEEQIFKIMRRGGFRVTAQLRRKFRDEGLRGDDNREAVQQALDELRDASDDELRALIEDAKEV